MPAWLLSSIAQWITAIGVGLCAICFGVAIGCKFMDMNWDDLVDSFLETVRKFYEEEEERAAIRKRRLKDKDKEEKR